MSVTQPCYQTYVIAPGGSISIPGGSTVLAVDASDPSVLTTPCPSVEDQIQNAEPYQCYGLGWTLDTDSDGPLGDVGAQIVYVSVGGTQYDFKISAFMSAVSLQQEFVSRVPQGLMKVYSVLRNDSAQHRIYQVFFKSTPSISKTIEVKLTGRGFEDGAYVKPVDWTCPDSGS